MHRWTHGGTVVLALGIAAGAAQAQWVTYTNQTATRLVADPSVGTADGMERDYAGGDFDRDGRPDLVVVRKVPSTVPGGRRGVLLMNENGVLTDRTAEKASASDVPGSMGLLDQTNARDVKAVDVNNDGWLDLVTAVDISDGLPKYIGHPRVYINLGSVRGVWQGFRFENARIPQLVTITGLTDKNPRFSDVAPGDVTGDGFADLYFSDHDTGEVGPGEPSANDFNNRLLINDGKGFFTDESLARMGPTYTSQWLLSFYGIAGAIADFNNDGANDVMRVSTLGVPLNVAIAYNDPTKSGFFTTQPFSVVTAASGDPYGLSIADLNHDGRMDLIVSTDSQDRVVINTGTALVSGFPVATWSFTLLGTQSNGFQAESTVADLNNDGWQDFIITDMDDDGYYTGGGTRYTQIYHNVNGTSFPNDNGNIPQASRKMIHDVAAMDINGDCWLDLVFAQLFNDIPGVETGTTTIWINNAPAGPDCAAATCPADFDGNHVVDGLDLAQFLGAWTGAAFYSFCPPYTNPCDLFPDCHVNGLDLAIVLGGWGPCP